MVRGLSCGLLATVIAMAVLVAAGATKSSPTSPVLERFFSLNDSSPVEYRARRHLEAHNDRFDSSAWLDAVTESDATHGFHYEITAQGGSGYIRSRVLVPALEAERDVVRAHDATRGALTEENYIFEDRGEEKDGLAWVTVKPRRHDVLLVDGSIFVNPDDGDLVRLEGRLSKTPSAWTRRVEIVRSFRRFAGVRVPVALESVATLFIAGRSTFRMTYDYEIVNDRQVAESSKLTTR